MSGEFQSPIPINEPVRSYAPGTPERTALKAKLKEIASEEIEIPVIIGRGGPRMVPGFVAIRETLESMELPYVIFGHDTPLTLVAEYAAKVAKSLGTRTETSHES